MFECVLPSTKKITFRAPSFVDRRNILRQFERNDGYMPEDLLAAKCLTHVDDRIVEEDWATLDPISIFDSWDLRDQQYYLEVFMNMFSLDEKAKNAAQETAKKLMGATPAAPTPIKAAKLTT